MTYVVAILQPPDMKGRSFLLLRPNGSKRILEKTHLFHCGQGVILTTMKEVTRCWFSSQVRGSMQPSYL